MFAKTSWLMQDCISLFFWRHQHKTGHERL